MQVGEGTTHRLRRFHGMSGTSPGMPGARAAADPCNADAAAAGGKYALLLMLATLGYVMADVAADGLTVLEQQVG